MPYANTGITREVVTPGPNRRLVAGATSQPVGLPGKGPGVGGLPVARPRRERGVRA